MVINPVAVALIVGAAVWPFVAFRGPREDDRPRDGSKVSNYSVYYRKTDDGEQVKAAARRPAGDGWKAVGGPFLDKESAERFITHPATYQGKPIWETD